ncbi:hypothetical protein [Tengunoibacter tsumagoiensis]|uniref:Uncharacterized protein n=1 Tax=Tengunoibacter tsumagoiensis TaxID=2014871 RepID=A0A402A571_9CHLR|nr:hypothetical protein [Tengunoibacter tsumagoiensis]GCE14206.1 hypothetical protein KTT_40650 [Tengunoibacter tsumagoiensis]GCE14260.1 hypothetical protein KTT_41190 [Tengunoibacter tsumagoiensis]
MALNTVTTGNTVLAADINQLVNVLQRPSGSTETGKYFLIGSSYASGANASNYIPSLSRTSTPVSITIDEADMGHVAGGCNTAVAGHLTANGFQVNTSGTGASLSWSVGGNYTIQY